MADSRLCALAMAWKSPVKCRLMSSIGTTWAYPPPAAPPFTPKTGPSEGSRMQSAAFVPIFRNACVTPTVTVDLPSPAGVGLIPVTSTSRPLSLRSEEHTSELQSQSNLVCRLLLEKNKVVLPSSLAAGRSLESSTQTNESL